MGDANCASLLRGLPGIPGWLGWSEVWASVLSRKSVVGELYVIFQKTHMRSYFDGRASAFAQKLMAWSLFPAGSGSP